MSALLSVDMGQASMTIGDARDIVKIAALTLIAWLLPPRFWRKAAMATCTAGRADPCLPAYRKILAHKYPDSEFAGIGWRNRVYIREQSLQILGLHGPWRAWRPDIRLNGTEHLRNALAAGHGAILWVTDSAFTKLIVKMALHHEGYHVCQLSRPGHGFSPTPFGIRFLNPIWTRIENRYIAERILIRGEYATDALAVLRARLAANRIVIIAVAPSAHKFAEAPLLGTKFPVPTGPIRLAKATGAALLPVFAVAKENGQFEVSIQEPLDTAGGQEDNDSVAAAYAKRLELFVLDYPDQWTGWHWLASRVRAT
jgi:lauroyl/myristoyl acyltransferase